MAFYRTIVARTGYVEELIATLGRNGGLVSRDGQWLGPVAATEAEAIEAANEHFEESHKYDRSVFAPDSTEVWEFTDATGEVLIGWSANADGWFEDEDED
jgi:hypothetical protein